MFLSERSNSSLSEKDDNSIKDSPNNRKRVPGLNLTPLQNADGKKSVSHNPTPESKKYTDVISPGEYPRRTHSISIVISLIIKINMIETSSFTFQVSNA